jgi:hypothetical protein
MSFYPVLPVESAQSMSIVTFNNLKAAIDDIYSVIGTVAVNNSAPGNYEYGPNEDDNVGSIITFIHTCRYLQYEGNGVISDPSGVGGDVSISDPDNTDEVGEYDLDSVEWLGYGMQYRVSGVNWCFEYDKGGIL